MPSLFCAHYLQKTLLAFTGLAAVLGAAISLSVGEAQATSITGKFQIQGTVIGTPVSGVEIDAGQHIGQSFGSGDFVHDEQGMFTVYVNWFDQDTFVVRIENVDTTLDPTTFSVDLTLKNLTFAGGETISNVVFNPNGGGYRDFFFDPINNPTGAEPVLDPAVTFGTSQVRVVYGSDWGTQNHPAGPFQLIGDAPALFFDVRTSAAAAVPEPGTVFLLLTGLVGFGLTRWRTLQGLRS